MAKKKVNCKEFTNAVPLFLRVPGMPSHTAANQLNDKNPTDDNHSASSEEKDPFRPCQDTWKDSTLERTAVLKVSVMGNWETLPLRKLLYFAEEGEEREWAVGHLNSEPDAIHPSCERGMRKINSVQTDLQASFPGTIFTAGGHRQNWPLHRSGSALWYLRLTGQLTPSIASCPGANTQIWLLSAGLSVDPCDV